MILSELEEKVWDAVVIGAGPAGCMAAMGLARWGASVLLLEKQGFPREKACGCCVTASSLNLLRKAGLSGMPALREAVPLNGIELSAGRARARFPLPEGAVVLRSELDSALAGQAAESGCIFLQRTCAKLGDVREGMREVRLDSQGEERRIRARVVLAASGLQGLHEEESGERPVPAAGSRVGVAALMPEGPNRYRPGIVYMACGRKGYAGVVRLRDGRLNVAAAVDPGLLRSAGGAAGAVGRLFAEGGLPAMPMQEATWRGTPPLTQARCDVARERLFFLGDAAGYVEPFTGEGIAWALASGWAIVPVALQAARAWSPSLAAEWASLHHLCLRQRQEGCRRISRLLRRPALTRAAVRILSWAPQLARPFVLRVSASLS